RLGRIALRGGERDGERERCANERTCRTIDPRAFQGAPFPGKPAPKFGNAALSRARCFRAIILPGLFPATSPPPSPICRSRHAIARDSLLSAHASVPARAPRRARRPHFTR